MIHTLVILMQQAILVLRIEGDKGFNQEDIARVDIDLEVACDQVDTVLEAALTLEGINLEVSTLKVEDTTFDAIVYYFE